MRHPLSTSRSKASWIDLESSCDYLAVSSEPGGTHDQNVVYVHSTPSCTRTYGYLAIYYDAG